MKYLYHGSTIPNLKLIKPVESGHGKNYVYAVSELAFAAIFSVRKKNSLTAKWGRNNKGTPYFCERVEGIFELLYQNKKSSIYKLESKNFYQKKNMWKEEYVSEKGEPVVEEVKIKNIKEFLLKLEQQRQFQLIKYKDRKKYYPNIDDETINIAILIAKKYSKERAIKVCMKWRPDILDTVKEILEETL